MRRGHRQVGLDLGRARVKVAERDGAGRIVRLASFRRRVPGASLDESEASWIAAGLERKGFGGVPVVVGACIDSVRVDEIELPAVKPGISLDRIVQQEVARMGRGREGEIALAWWPIGASARGGAHSALAVSCPISASERIAEPLASSGLDVISIDLRQAASARLSARGRAESGLVVVVDIGWGSAEVTAWQGSEPVFVRTLDRCGLREAGSIVPECDADGEEGVMMHPWMVHDRVMLFEQIVRHDASDPVLEQWRRRVAARLHGLANELATEVEKTLVYLSRRFGGLDAATLCFAGGGAALEAVMRPISARLGAAEVCVPAERCDVAGVAVERAREPMFVSACGLALWEGGR